MITPELIITNSYLAEINFSVAPTAGSRIYFQDIPTLTPRDGKTVIETVGLECFSDNELSYSANGNKVTSAANCATLLLTLSIGSIEKIYQIPVNTLRPQVNGGLIRRFYCLPVNIVKSYVQVVTTGVSAGESICFNFYYRQRALK